MENFAKVERIESRKNGAEVFAISNEILKVIVTNWGCHILSIFTPDREGHMEDVVLGLENIDEIPQDGSYAGAVIGRVANRIGGAAFDLSGHHYPLAKNNGKNHLHGGKAGFDQKLWDYEINNYGISFHYLSVDGEEGYPGNLDVVVDYILIEDCLQINYYADCDQDTLCNLTNHSYFDLSAGKRSVCEQELFLDADRFACVDENGLTTGSYRKVTGSAFDFQVARKIGERIDETDEQLFNAKGYDHSFLLKRGKDAIILRDWESGRELRVSTSYPTVHVYSGNFLADGRNGKGGKPYENRAGIAFETQFLANGIQIEEKPEVILRKGERYQQHTVFQFRTLK